MRGNFDYFYHLVNVMGLSLSQSGRINPLKLKKKFVSVAIEKEG
jgi:hypothetical protein